MTRVRNITATEYDSKFDHDQKVADLKKAGWIKVGEIIDPEGITWTRFRLRNGQNYCEVMKQ